MQKYKAIDRLLNRISLTGERELARAYAVSLKEIRSLIALAFEKYGGDFTEMQKYGRLSRLEKSIALELGKLSSRSVIATRKAIATTYSQSYYTTGWFVETGVQNRLGFGLLNKESVKAAIYGPFKWNESVREHTKILDRQIRSSIMQGLIQGKSYQQIARDIREPVEKSAYKAMRIIRTETHRVQIQGRLDALEKAEDAGVEFGLQWIATLDERTRDTHQEMDKQMAEKIDGEFWFTLPSGIKTTGPGLSGDPAEDINCRCSAIPVIEGFTSQRRANVGGKSEIVDDMSYKEWAKLKGID